MPRTQTGSVVTGVERRTPDFYVFTNALVAKHPDDAERPTVLATASSNAIDLEGDRFTKESLKQMEEGFKGRLVFLNHRYSVPGDVFGQIVDTKLVAREGRTDLDITIEVEMTNPAAAMTYQMIANGTRLGVSVGVLVREVEKTDEESEFGKVVNIVDVIPLEASIVGIPANQTAWTQEAIKSLFERGALDLDEDDITARPWLVVEVGHTDTNRWQALRTLGKGAVSSHAPAKAPQDRAWTASAAVKRLRSWAGGPDKEGMKWAKYRTGFAWFNGEDAENFGSYKLPHHDIVNSSFVVVFRGAVAAAVVLQGGRGGVSIPEGDAGSTKAHIARHYHQFDEKAPWEREKEDGWLDIEIEAAEELIALGVIDELPAFEATFSAEEDTDMAQKHEETDETAAPAQAEAEAEAAAGDEAPVEGDAPATADDETPTDDAPTGDEPAADDAPTGDEPAATGDEPAAEGDAAPAEATDDDAPTGDEDEEKDASAEPEAKGEFEDDVNADLAADVLIDKQFSGFRVLLNNLIDILLNTDLNIEDRRKAGMEIVEEYQEFTEKTWNETLDSLDEADKSGDAETVKSGIAKRLHDFVAQVDALECSAEHISDVTKTIEDIQETVKGLTEENKTLKDENERLKGAITEVDKVLETIMDMPLGAVTQQAAAAAGSLADAFPMLHPEVRERMARFRDNVR